MTLVRPVPDPDFRPKSGVLAHVDTEPITAVKTPVQYTISQAAAFFNCSVHWLRWREQEGCFRYPDGTMIMPHRGPLKISGGPPIAPAMVRGDRKYTLKHLWYMVRSLERFDLIGPEHASATLNVLRALNEINKFEIKKKPRQKSIEDPTGKRKRW